MPELVRKGANEGTGDDSRRLTNISEEDDGRASPKEEAGLDNGQGVDQNQAISFEECLYIGNVFVSNDRLESDRLITINFRCFNGTQASLFVRGIEGNVSIALRKDKETVYNEVMEQPSITAVTNDGAEKGRCKDFSVSLDQRLPAHIVEDLMDFARSHQARINCQLLKIWVSPTENPSEKYRLPVFDSISLVLDAKRFHAGRVVFVSSRNVVTMAPISA